MVRWTTGDDLKLLHLHKENPTLWMREIAEMMARSYGQVLFAARRLGIKSTSKKGSYNSKHSHLAKDVMTYFLTHTQAETAKKFGLTSSEFKSLFTLGYRKPELAHLRKDNRRKDPWSLDDILLAVQCAGIQPRSWVGKRLGRGGDRVVKEKFQAWNASTKYLHGLPITWIRELFPTWWVPKSALVLTHAGPGSVWRFNILLWADCVKLATFYKEPDYLIKAMRAMAKFSQFIYRTKDSNIVRKRINTHLKENT